MITARIDLDAIAANVEVLRRHAAQAQVMAVVKADGYGHGAVASARAAVAGGASWLGTATIEEALELRAAGLTVPILSWIFPMDGDLIASAIASDIDLSASTVRALDEIAEQATAVRRIARVQLKIDSGLGRGGATSTDWPAVVEAAAKYEAGGAIDMVAIWSHLAHADAPAHPTILAQQKAFEAALDVAVVGGVVPKLRHLANSAATLAAPDLHYDLVRPGIAVYGLTPGPLVGSTSELGLRPAMTMTATVALAKRVPPGQGVSYGHRYTTTKETTLALVPAGYADGVPRAATNAAEVWLHGSRRRIAGTVCMDQFVVDVADDPVEVGDEVVLWGPGDAGEPTADDWAAWLATINYEIVTRTGPRVHRVYSGTAGVGG